MQSGRAVFIPAALAAGLITTNSSRFQNRFDYPAISVVSPFRRDKGLFLPLLRLLCSCSLNISISGHAACKQDFLTPPSFPLADFWLDSRVKSRRKREVLFAWTLEIPHLTDHHGVACFFHSVLQKGNTWEPAHFLPPAPGTDAIFTGTHLHPLEINPRTHTLSLHLSREQLVQGQCPERGGQGWWCKGRTHLPGKELEVLARRPPAAQG